MYLFIDERDIVTNSYASKLNDEGIVTTSFMPKDFHEWMQKINTNDSSSIEAVILGNCNINISDLKNIKNKIRAPLLILSENKTLDTTLEYFEAGVDDVIKKPVHVKEILARIAAIKRRQSVIDDKESRPIKVYYDGRDPVVNQKVLILPRRERRILEYLMMNENKRVTKTQIFNAIYGLFDDHIDEDVIESHISKLRKKIKFQLGWDPIDSKRYIGYMINFQL